MVGLSGDRLRGERHHRSQCSSKACPARLLLLGGKDRQHASRHGQPHASYGPTPLAHRASLTLHDTFRRTTIAMGSCPNCGEPTSAPVRPSRTSVSCSPRVGPSPSGLGDGLSSHTASENQKSVPSQLERPWPNLTSDIALALQGTSSSITSAGSAAAALDGRSVGAGVPLLTSIRSKITNKNVNPLAEQFRDSRCLTAWLCESIWCGVGASPKECGSAHKHVC